MNIEWQVKTKTIQSKQNSIMTSFAYQLTITQNRTPHYPESEHPRPPPDIKTSYQQSVVEKRHRLQYLLKRNP